MKLKNLISNRLNCLIGCTTIFLINTPLALADWSSMQALVNKKDVQTVESILGARGYAFYRIEYPDRNNQYTSIIYLKPVGNTI
jgi:hypothetical protein